MVRIEDIKTARQSLAGARGTEGEPAMNPLAREPPLSAERQKHKSGDGPALVALGCRVGRWAICSATKTIWLPSRQLLISLLKGLNYLVRKVSSFTHFAQFAMQWGFSPRPEWFDHYLDQHWQWSAKNNSLWVERGVFSRMVIKPNARMLEICCGDGFNARHFYSSRASSITAVDFDKDAIPHARRYNSAPNITYVQQDIRDGLPAGSFDNIVWDAAIEHFTETEISKILRDLAGRLGGDGVLSGYTIVEAADGRKGNALHEYEFKDKEDLRRFFTPHFSFVKVWETFYPTRHNLYFVASQAPIDVFG